MSSEKSLLGEQLRVRTITVFLEPAQDPATRTKQIDHAAAFLRAAQAAYEDAGYEVQTTRVATTPWTQWADAADPAGSVFEMQRLVTSAGIMLLSVGPASIEAFQKQGLGGVQQLRAVIERMAVECSRTSSSLQMPPLTSGPEVRAAAELGAELTLSIADQTAGEGNFRFCVASGCPPGIPYFPVAYSPPAGVPAAAAAAAANGAAAAEAAAAAADGAAAAEAVQGWAGARCAGSFAIGLENTCVLHSAFKDAQGDLDTAAALLDERMYRLYGRVQDIARKLEAASSSSSGGGSGSSGGGRDQGKSCGAGSISSIEAGRGSSALPLSSPKTATEDGFTVGMFMYGGIDASFAPGLDTPGMTDAFGQAVSFGGHGSLATAERITGAIKALSPRISLCGYSGLMLPVCEDVGLAAGATEGSFCIRDLLWLSAVCGCGLDTVPVPGRLSAAGGREPPQPPPLCPARPRDVPSETMAAAAAAGGPISGQEGGVYDSWNGSGDANGVGSGSGNDVGGTFGDSGPGNGSVGDERRELYNASLAAGITGLVLDMHALATRLRKPLACRLLPQPDKLAGEQTTFTNPYLLNCSVMKLE